jgi:hypothetical protein
MIRKIGTGETGEPLVLAELNADEKRALGDILFAADKTFYGKPGRAKITVMMIDAMRDMFGIPADPAARADR